MNSSSSSNPLYKLTIGIFAIILISYVIYAVRKNNPVSVSWGRGVTANNFNGWQASDALRDETLYRGAPDYIDSTRGGRAIWTTKTLRQSGSPLSRVEIIDHFNPQIWPYTHDAFVHYYVYVGDDLAAKIGKIEFPTINFDSTTKSLHIAGTFSAQNQIILAEYLDAVRYGAPIDLEKIRMRVIEKIRANKFDPYATYSLEKSLKFDA